jgi:hypothetical protein
VECCARSKQRSTRAQRELKLAASTGSLQSAMRPLHPPLLVVIQRSGLPVFAGIVA